MKAQVRFDRSRGRWTVKYNDREYGSHAKPERHLAFRQAVVVTELFRRAS